MMLTMDGCYSRLLRYILNIKYSPDADKVSNAKVYRILREKRQSFVGHCLRITQPMADILL
jgi:hypothetical protein